MELLLPGRFEDSATAYGYVRIIFDQVAGGSRPATFSITPSTRHVGVTRRDTFRPGFRDAVGAAGEMGYPVLVRSSGGGATAADRGTFGFSIIRPYGREGVWTRHQGALRRGGGPGPRRLLASRGDGRGGGGARRVLPGGPQHKGWGWRRRHENRGYRAEDHTPGDERRGHRARRGRAGAGARARASLLRNAAALQTTERRQPAARRIRGGHTGRNRGLRRRSGAGLRRRPRQARREDAGAGEHFSKAANQHAPCRALVSTPPGFARRFLSISASPP